MKAWLRGPGVSALLSVLGLLAFWEFIARLNGGAGLSTPWEALQALPQIFGDPEALGNILDSIRRMMIGFLLALLIATPIGLSMGRSPAVAALLNPLLMVAYPVPKAALMPLIMLWLGVGDASKILVIALGVALPLLYHSYQGARAVEQKMLWSAAAMGMGGVQRLFKVVLPASLPQILMGCRTGIVIGLITMITSEMISRQKGAGNILFNALDMAQYETVYAMILVIGALGVVLDMGFEAIRVRLTRWADHQPGLSAATSA